MGGTWGNAGFGLHEIDDVEPEPAREIWPGIVIGDELDPGETGQSRAPALQFCVKPAQEAFASGENAGRFRGSAARERLGRARRDDGGVLRVEPKVRVRHAMSVAALVHHALA